jgi:hypothetical protein
MGGRLLEGRPSCQPTSHDRGRAAAIHLYRRGYRRFLRISFSMCERPPTIKNILRQDPQSIRYRDDQN